MQLNVYDDDGGVILEFDSEDGMAHSFFLSDGDALDMINMIQNKLDGHYK